MPTAACLFALLIHQGAHAGPVAAGPDPAAVPVPVTRDAETGVKSENTPTSPTASSDAATNPAKQPAEGGGVGTMDRDAINLLVEVLNRVRAQYVDQVSDMKIVEHAVSGLAEALDPHSSYMDEEKYHDHKTQTSGEFGGIGVELAMEDGLLKVITPIDDTPAFRAGILPNDIIETIDGAATSNLTFKEVLARLKGEIGTSLAIRIRRGDADPFDLTLTRALVKTMSVKFEADGTVGYIRISIFNKQTEADLVAAIEAIDRDLAGRLTGYVLDLRNNPGGLLMQSVKVADAFLDSGDIVSTRGRGGVETQRFSATPGDLGHGLPIIILMNEGSASASEIVAGALQDNHRAIVLGAQSFGKGSVQTVMPMLASRGALRITTGRYYTPSGRSIQKLGITPDIVVEQAKLEPLKQSARRKEADLKGALTNDSAPSQDPASKPLASQKRDANGKAFDYQRERAIDILEGSAKLQRPPLSPAGASSEASRPASPHSLKSENHRAE
jgi:carboxyl-terminal processing protease